MTDFRLALCNVLRNRRRSLIALATLAFAAVALVLAGGFIEYLLWAMREATIEARLGHIQIVRSGFFEAGVADPFSHLLSDNTTIEAEIRSTPHVAKFAPRLHFSGLVSFGDSTVSFIGEGVDAVVEKTKTKYLVMRGGHGLDKDDPEGVILGTGLAGSLGAAVGDRVVLLASTASGGINAVELSVRGLFSTSTKAYDDTVLRVPIDTARQLLRTKGSHAWVLQLDDTEKTPAVLSDLRGRFPIETTGLELVPWFVLSDFYNKTVHLFSRQMLVIQLIIAMIVLLSISNVAVMNVLERTTEIGTLMAIGLRRAKILRLFLSEGAILGGIGGTIGVFLGWVLSLLISAIGIPMPPPPGMDIGFVAEILVTPKLAGTGFALTVGSATLATLFPAFKASRLQIVDALRRGR